MAALLLIGAAALAFVFARGGHASHVTSVAGLQTFDASADAAIRRMLAGVAFEIVQATEQQITFRVRQVAEGVLGQQALELAAAQDAMVAGNLALAAMALEGKAPSGDVFVVAFRDKTLAHQIAGDGTAFAILP